MYLIHIKDFYSIRPYSFPYLEVLSILPVMNESTFMPSLIFSQYVNEYKVLPLPTSGNSMIGR